MLKSRPHFLISENPDDIDVLTPAHFLILSTFTSMHDSDVWHLNLDRLRRGWRRPSWSNPNWLWAMQASNEEVSCPALWNHSTMYGSSNGGSMSGAIKLNHWLFVIWSASLTTRM